MPCFLFIHVASVGGASLDTIGHHRRPYSGGRRVAERDDVAIGKRVAERDDVRQAAKMLAKPYDATECGGGELVDRCLAVVELAVRNPREIGVDHRRHVVDAVPDRIRCHLLVVANDNHTLAQIPGD